MTENGKKAINQHNLEFYKMGKARRFAARKMGYNQEIHPSEPYFLYIYPTKGSMFSLAKPHHVIEEIDEAMKQNGAIKETDYKIEVEE